MNKITRWLKRLNSNSQPPARSSSDKVTTQRDKPKFTARPDSARVSIEYTVQMISGAKKNIRLPFVVGVLADFHGGHDPGLPDADKRKMLYVEAERFDERMATLRPRLAFHVPNYLAGEGDLHIDLSLEALEHFDPASVAGRVAPIAEFIKRRDASTGDPEAMDTRLNRQLSAIIHHPDFQQLESAWRGLHHLVSRTDTSDMLKIRILSLSKRELAEACAAEKGDSWDKGWLYEVLYHDEAHMFGGELFGCIIGDYYFDHSPEDIQILRYISKIASRAHAPFLAAAAPSLFHMDRWDEISNPFDVDFAAPEYTAWHEFRDRPESRFIGLAMPRFLARQTYDGIAMGNSDYRFREQVLDVGIDDFTWANPAYLMGATITRAFNSYGWFSRIRGIESGGEVQGLPTHPGQTDTGEPDPLCSVEVGITDRREHELSRFGLMPVLSKKNADFVAFIGATSLHKWPVYEDDVDTMTAALSARFPYLLCTSRVVHYLICISRDLIGRFTSGHELQDYLNDWIAAYVDSDPLHSDSNRQAERPLLAGRVEILHREGNDTARAVFYCQPHYQLEGLQKPIRAEFQLGLPSPRE